MAQGQYAAGGQQAYGSMVAQGGAEAATAAAVAGKGGEAGKKNKKVVRIGAGTGDVWEDKTLNEWPDSKYCNDV